VSLLPLAVLRAVARRMRQEGRLNQRRDPNLPEQLFQFSDYQHAVATPEGLKLQEYVEELVERPPIADVLHVVRGLDQRAEPAIPIPQDGQSAHVKGRQQQKEAEITRTTRSAPTQDKDHDDLVKPLCAPPGTRRAPKDQENVSTQR
jgi:hypothetical protein